MKIDVETVEIILKNNKFPDPDVKKVIKQIEDQIELDKAAATKQKRAKNKTLILAASTEPLAANVRETPCWIFQVPDEFDHNNLVPTISKVIAEFMLSGKKKALKITSVGSGIQIIPNKFWKAHSITRKTKEPVLVEVTDNIIQSSSAQ